VEKVFEETKFEGSSSMTEPVVIGYEEKQKGQDPRSFELHDDQGKLKIAYIMSRFPKITETFILYEMLALEETGIRVELFPLLRQHANITHAEAESFIERAHYLPFISIPILRSQLHFLRTKPIKYFQTLWRVIQSNWGSFRFFFGALAIFPKSVCFADLMESEGINHIHAHFASHPAAAAWIIHNLVGIPYSFTAHGSDLHRDRHMLREKVEGSSFVIPISLYNRNMIIEECGQEVADKLRVVHCGVDTGVFKPLSEDRNDPEAKALRVLCIGTLHEVKGQTYLIEACRLLHSRGIEVFCNFVGAGPDDAYLKQQVTEAGLSNYVTFLDEQPRSEIVRWIHDAHVVVAPSVPSRDGRREGIPVVLMEAMSSGKPVVASRLSGIPELVDDGENGFLTTPGDAEEIADALERLHDSRELRIHMGREGREKVIRQFDTYKNALLLANQFRNRVYA
jgi:colanic acid/amylovoran biosynthesis glycosyltransferase